MTESAVLCPFCNAQIQRVADTAKPLCPRCDTPLPSELAAKLGRGVSAPVQPQVPGTKKTLLATLGVMVTMAALTVGYTLWTQNFRRQNDFKKGIILTEAAAQAPDEWTTIGLIPARCHIVGGANLAELRANAIAKSAIAEDAPRAIAYLQDQLKATTGLTLNDIEQASLGIEVVNGSLKIFVIVQTKAPYDAQTVQMLFAPAKATMVRNHPAIRFPLPYVGDGTVWCMSDRHLAFLFRSEQGPIDDLEAIPVKPRTKLDGSPAALQAIVKDRIDKQSLVWVAADMTPTVGLIEVLAGFGAKIEPYRPLLSSKAIAISMKADTDIVLLGQVLAKSAKDMQALEGSLRDMDWRGEKSKKVEATPPDAPADPWVTLQLRYDPASLRPLLSQGPGFKSLP